MLTALSSLELPAVFDNTALLRCLRSGYFVSLAAVRCIADDIELIICFSSAIYQTPYQDGRQSQAL